MEVHLWTFLGVALVVIVAPGPDMALVTRNAVLHGRRAALGTALGVNAGLLLWTIASALGLAAVLRASGTAFTVLRLVGAVYLVWLGVEALRAARSHSSAPRQVSHPGRGRTGAAVGFRQGLLSNVANPKIGVFFTTVLPQFASGGQAVLIPFLLLGGLFVVLTLAWLSACALVASGASSVLLRPSIRSTLDRVTGIVLIGLGLRVATERA